MKGITINGTISPTEAEITSPPIQGFGVIWLLMHTQKSSGLGRQKGAQKHTWIEQKQETFDVFYMRALMVSLAEVLTRNMLTRKNKRAGRLSNNKAKGEIRPLVYLVSFIESRKTPRKTPICC